MYEYDIISPANEHELSERLRAQPLTSRVLELTVKKVLDELSVRRGDSADEEMIEFHVDTLHLDRPTAIMGRAVVATALRAARIDALDEHDDDRENKLRLVVASDD